MLRFRLRETRIELQAHRTWLQVFQARHADNSLRCFSSVHVQGQEQEQSKRGWNPIARARAKAEAQQRRENILVSDGASGSSLTLSEAQRRKRERWAGRRSGPQTVQLRALGIREDLLKAVVEYNTAAVFHLYNELPEKRPLATADFQAIAQCTHQALRAENQRPAGSQSAEKKQEIVAFAETLVEDIRRGNLVPSHRANVHLLAIFKESGHLESGIKFWNWLQAQDDQHVRVEVYAVAIELFAMHRMPLADLEALYNKALARFPGNFSAYHLSPNAIVPDRSALTSIKGLPISLLRAITSARLMRGDSRQAYLAIDTIFRLFPTAVDPRFVTLFLEERPISEVYTLFALACRANLVLPPAIIRRLISRLRKAAEDDASVLHRIASLRAMLAVMYLHLGATGKALPNNLSELIIATTSIFRLPGVDKLEGGQRKKLVDAVLLSIRRMLETFARLGILPSTSAFNSILINVAGYGGSRETLGIVLEDLKAMKLEPTDVTRRSVLAVGGLWEDQKLIEASWGKLVEARRLRGEVPETKDFFVLAKAVKATGEVAFAEKQFHAFKTSVPEECHSSVEYAISQAREPQDVLEYPAKDVIKFEEVCNGIERLNADLELLEADVKAGSGIQDFSKRKLPLYLLKFRGALDASDEVFRKVYDEMTTEKSNSRSEVPDAAEPGSDALAPSSAPDIRSGNSPTLNDLRFESWKAINYLLQLAEKHDKDYNGMVDHAISNGERPPARNMGFTDEELDNMGGFGLSDCDHVEKRKQSQVSVEDFKQEVIRLRAIVPTA